MSSVRVASGLAGAGQCDTLLEHPAGLVTDPVGTRLEDLAEQWAASCIVEDPHGRILSHALRHPLPTAGVDAILSRCAAPLHRARYSSRTVGVIAGGPVLVGKLTGWTGHVTIIPLSGMGFVWIFHHHDRELAQWAAGAEQLRDVLRRQHGTATDETVLEMLEGQREAATRPDAWLAVIRPTQPSGHDTSPVDLHRALWGQLPAGMTDGITVADGVAYLILHGTPKGRSMAEVVTECLQQVGDRLGVDLVGAISSAELGLSHARDQAERALRARSEPGICLKLEQCRPYEVLSHLLDAVAHAPALGGDPLVELLRAGTPLVAGLRAWLDCHGDIAAAARLTGVHPNTLRYRVKKARSLVPADLNDPVARLELHLRLLALPTTGPR